MAQDWVIVRQRITVIEVPDPPWPDRRVAAQWKLVRVD
jgi:hypothetical protein